jgi:hypothetical protein
VKLCLILINNKSFVFLVIKFSKLMLFQALENSYKLNTFLFCNQLFISHHFLAVQDNVLLFSMVTLHITLVLLSGITNCLVKCVPQIIEFWQYFKLLGFFILRKNICQHSVSAFNLGIDQFLVNLFVSIVSFVRCVLLLKVSHSVTML